MDSNRDDHISLEEFLGGDPLFKQADADGDGLLTAQEAATLTKSAGSTGQAP
jgi:hypothetical protein